MKIFRQQKTKSGIRIPFTNKLILLVEGVKTSNLDTPKNLTEFVHYLEIEYDTGFWIEDIRLLTNDIIYARGL